MNAEYDVYFKNVMKDNTVGVFFALLRAGLWEGVDANFDENLLEIFGTSDQGRAHPNEKVDWNGVYQLAEEQSVVGVVLAGIEHSNIKPPQDLLLQWIGEVQILEQQNKEMNQFIAELIEKMRAVGIYTLLVKGQGVAQCYEKPLWRANGDIDLFLSTDNYDKAKLFLQPLGYITETEEASKRHFAMQIGQWVVELHGTLHGGLSNSLDKVLDDVQEDVFYGGCVRSWLNNRTQVFLPGVNCDAVYIFTHIIQHFYKGGIGLRQICDWCRLLWTYRESLNHEYLESKIREAGLRSEWKSFGAFSVEYLGMPVEAMPLLDVRCKKEDGRSEIDVNLRKKADKIGEFILEVGNFGHNRDNSYFQKHSYFVQKSISAWRRVKDLCRHATIFPVNSVRFFFGIMHNGIVSAIRGE